MNSVSRLIRALGIALGVVLIGFLSSGEPGSKSSPFCAQVETWLPNLRWQVAQTGQQLRNFDAIMACEASTVTIRANIPFASEVRWTKDGEWYRGTIPAKTTIIVVDERDERVPVSVEILATRGRVFFSDDRDVIERSGLSLLRGSNLKAREQSEKAMFAELQAMTWRVLRESEPLGPWDLVWTGQTGRVELEIITPGPEYVWDGAADVRTPDGRLTRRKRFFEYTMFAMHPAHYRVARIVSVIGNVWVATDRQRARDFIQKHGILVDAFGPSVGEPEWKRLEKLSRPDLD